MAIAIHELVYKDCGRQFYKCPEYVIIKYRTFDENRDAYISSSDMDIAIADI